MNITIHSVSDLGLALRATRKGSKIRLDDLADFAGVSKQFVSDVEYGKKTVQLGLVLRLLDEMGLYLTVDIPPDAEEPWSALVAQGGLTSRSSKKRSTISQ